MDQFLGRETFLSLCRVSSDGSKSVAEYLILFLTDLMQLSTATEAPDSFCSRLLWMNEWTWLSWSSKRGPRKKFLLLFARRAAAHRAQRQSTRLRSKTLEAVGLDPAGWQAFFFSSLSFQWCALDTDPSQRCNTVDFLIKICSSLQLEVK